MQTPAAVVIGGSAGSLQVLLSILPSLPAGYRIPVAVVVHLPPTGRSLMPRILGDRCALPVVEIEDKQPLEPGAIYVAPAGYHVLIDEGPAFALSVEERVKYSIPSIDVLFVSAARRLREQLVAVLLTGASDDGAAGLAAATAAGGVALVQSPQEATSPTMPEAGIASTPRALVRRASGIRDHLLSLDPAGGGAG